MSRTYTVTGINLQGKPLGEGDRLLTILTPEQGLIRAVAPGSRKYQSRLRGRSELFVVNQLFLVKGRSLDKITQAETLKNHAGLSSHLTKLAAGQYLGELVICLALEGQPQTEIYQLLLEHLNRIEQLPSNASVLPLLNHALFHFLVIAGLAPVTHRCCITQQGITPQQQSHNWQVGFSYEAGGLVSELSTSSLRIDNWIGAPELTLLQQLGAQTLPDTYVHASFADAWIKLESLLRNYTQYHLGRVIYSASLISDSTFLRTS